jgi:hypothetical protein
MLEPLKNVFGQNGMPLTPKPETWPKSPQGNLRTNSKPPLVIPEIMPIALAKTIFQPDEYDSITEFLEIYVKKRPDWDQFRAKVPEILLHKFRQWLSGCRKNGFIAPYVEGGEIHWHQIVSNNRKYVDKCTLCNRPVLYHTCNGRMIEKNGQRNFRVCWGEG